MGLNWMKGKPLDGDFEAPTFVLRLADGVPVRCATVCSSSYSLLNLFHLFVGILAFGDLQQGFTISQRITMYVTSSKLRLSSLATAVLWHRSER